MKKFKFTSLLMTLAVAALAFAGCNTEDVDYKVAQLKVTPADLSFGGQGGEMTFDIEANRDWTISVVEAGTEWLSFSPESGNGNQTVTVTALPNSGITRTATIKVASSTVYDYVKVTQVGSVATTVLYNITFGEGAPSSGTYPYLDQWEESLGESGDGASTAKPTGTGVSLRTSGRLSSGYPGASGGNRLFFGTDGELTINSISTLGSTKFQISFGAQRYINSDNTFIPENLILSVSADGSQWEEVEYNFSSEYSSDWVYCTTEYELEQSSSTLYLKYEAKENSAFAIDDVNVIAFNASGVTDPTVTTGNATSVTETGAILNGSYALPSSGTYDVTEVGFEYKTGSGSYTTEAAAAVAQNFTVTLSALTQNTEYTYRAYATIDGTKVYGGENKFTTLNGSVDENLLFNITFGTGAPSSGTYPFLDKWTGDLGVSGRGSSTFNHTGSLAVSLRTSGRLSSGYPNASGGNRLFFGTNATLLLNDISTLGSTSYDISFGAQRYIDNDGTFKPENLIFSVSTDGSNYTPYTYNYTSEYSSDWVYCTVQVDVSGTPSKIYLKFNATENSAFAVDDVRVVAKGGIIITEPMVTTGEASNVTENSATVSGTYESPEGTTITAVGIEYKTGSGAYTAINAAAVTSPFSVNLTGLTEATGYTYRAFAKTASDTYYGEEKTFATTSTSGGDYITVAQLRAIGAGGTIPAGSKLKATVISDLYGGNNVASKKNVTVSDGESGIMIRFIEDEERFAKNQEIELDLTGAVIAKYQDLLQLSDFTNAKASLTGATNTIAAKQITAAELVTGQYESMYVSVSDVQVITEDLGKTMGVTNTGTTRELEARTEQKFDMYTSQHATFVSNTVPAGSGTIKGIAAINNGKFQISPRDESDFADMNGQRFTIVVPLEFGNPSFTADALVTVNQAIQNGKITIPYTNAEGTESYNISVTVAGSGAAGILGDGIGAPVTRTLTAGDGIIELAVSGMPTAAGDVTFTISGISELTNNTCTTTVDEGGAKTEQLIFYTGFEDNTRDASASNSYTVAAKTYDVTEDGKVYTWNYIYADLITTGTPWAGDWQNMGRVAQNTTNQPIIEILDDMNDVDTEITRFTFEAVGVATLGIRVYYSMNQGSTWTEAGEFSGTNTSTKKEFEGTINATGKVRLRFEVYVLNGNTTSSNRDMKIDEVRVYGMQ